MTAAELDSAITHQEQVPNHISCREGSSMHRLTSGVCCWVRRLRLSLHITMNIDDDTVPNTSSRKLRTVHGAQVDTNTGEVILDCSAEQMTER